MSVLNISNMGLRNGNLLVPEIGNLSFLVSLDLSSNDFSGTLPQVLSRLKRLKILDLSYNNIRGDITIHPNIGGNLFPQLQILRVGNNSFTGLIPPSFSNMSKLEILDMSFNEFRGEIPQDLGRLEKLKKLYLHGNRLTGSIPLTLFNMSSLEGLSLSANRLSGGLPENLCEGIPRIQGIYLSLNYELSGKLPENMSLCSELRILTLMNNKFEGRIPRELGNVPTLERLNLAYNNFEGEIPETLGNATSLVMLEIYNNHLTGSIPPQIFNISSLLLIDLGNNSLQGMLPEDMCSSLKQLQAFSLEQNQMYGYIPPRLSECSSLQRLSLTFNRLEGPIPKDLGNLTLFELRLGTNNLTGEVPSSLFNISTLSILSLGWNQLTGNLPSDMGHGMPSLEWLDFSSNNFKSESPELNFITSLTNSINLRMLGINDNPLNGRLPSSIGNFSRSLESIYAYGCQLKGSIPHEIGNLSNLIILSLYQNQLNGPLPESLGNMKNLQGLTLYQNKIHGSIPNTICKLSQLFELVLNDNRIGNGIPDCIGNLTYLRDLELANNQLNSTLPANLWLLKDLQWLKLSSNAIVGSLAPEVGNLKSVIGIDLSMNKLSGIIPSSIEGLITLAILSLDHNNFQGSIPETISQIISLENLDLSYNNLSGEIPTSLQKLQHLIYFNVSFNHLSGEIPSDGPFKSFSSRSFLPNEGLCGDLKYNVPTCPVNNTLVGRSSSRKKLKLIVIIVSVSSISAIGIFLSLAIAFSKYKVKLQQGHSHGSFQFLFIPTPLRFSYYELLGATDRYSESNLLGTGSFGSVYRGTLRSGKDVAVKVFNLDIEGAYKSFEVECKVLKELRHKNLCKVIGSCSNQDFKALVLEYMPHGSLEKWLYSHNYFLDLRQRISIMINVASALEYLHHGYSTPIVHCDIKPSNVLLDGDMIAHLSDFGVAKLLGDGESATRTMTLATLGYIAPEFGTDGFVSTRSDVYSYGIMLMEMFTRVKPQDEMFDGSLSLRSWVKDSMPNGTIHIMDSNLLKSDEEWFSEKVNCILSILELALCCSIESPSERITIKDVCVALEKVKLQVHAYYN